MNVGSKTELAAKLDAEIEIARRYLDTFARKFKDSPVAALESSASTFEIAATLNVYEQLRKACDSQHATLESMRGYAMNRAESMGTRRASSTSPTANLMDDCERIVWTRLVLDKMGGFLA